MWSSLTHEPDVSTLEFSNDGDSRSMTSDSLSYYMVFTGDLADTVSWDFGDGTSTEAHQVYKTYDSPGTYSILCKASNDNGDRYSGYTLEITEAEERGLLDGYGSEVMFLCTDALFTKLRKTTIPGEPKGLCCSARVNAQGACRKRPHIA